MASRTPRPTVIVAGAARSGKSALLEAAGARGDDEYAPSSDRALGRWWATEDAAFFELAERSFVGARSDRRRWFGATRERGTALGALVYTIDVEGLLDANDERREAIAVGLCDLVRDVAGPAFVAFTHVDRIHGFFESFSPIDDLAARVLGGAVEPRAGRATSFLVKELFDRNLAALHARALDRMNDAQAMADREAIYAFPLEMGWTLRVAAEALATLDRERAPRLAGVYFTSARQDDAWRSRAVAVMGRAFGIKGPMQDRNKRAPGPHEARAGSQPMFVLELFEAVLRECHRRTLTPDRGQ